MDLLLLLRHLIMTMISVLTRRCLSANEPITGYLKHSLPPSMTVSANSEGAINCRNRYSDERAQNDPLASSSRDHRGLWKKNTS
uniref:Putative secreted protein n=1 Tax=Anopheles darlingi TaxID=43151 RepID=A0A2M4DIH7_ANODA